MATLIGGHFFRDKKRRTLFSPYCYRNALSPALLFKPSQKKVTHIFLSFS